eukprot:Sspe_Gene.103774::Locus_79624_Transcript_1_1_Confidence_1.000_Length_1747::g.103774::m.103774/K05349/bglX; beta-glucosidase
MWAVVLLAAVATASPKERWMDPRLPVAERVNALLPKLSVEEMAAQLRCIYGNKDDIVKKYSKTGVGSVSVMGIEERNSIQAAVINGSRFGIPVAWIHESLHGGCSEGTIFPMPLTMGASFNTTLVEAIYQVVAAETRICGANIAFAPVINLFTDPRFGRFQEGFSPNPSLTAKLAVAAVSGLQGPTGNATTYLAADRVVSLAKHFAGYGGAVGGLNAAPLDVGERKFRDEYLKPWRYFAAAGGRGAMPSHQTVFDVPMHANPYLMNTVFRQELGFGEGITISDCNDINVLQDYRIAANVTEAAAKGLLGGVDQDLQCGTTETYTAESIGEALAIGMLPKSTLEAAVRHVLTMKFASGLFEAPFADPDAVKTLDSAPRRALARESAHQGTVLLKNVGKALPLTPAQRGVALFGELAGAKGLTSYTGSYTAQGAHVVSVLEALQARLGNVPYVEGAGPDSPSVPTDITQAVELANRSSVAVVVVGDSLHTCGEWTDRSTLDLPGGQLDLLAALGASKVESIIVVLITGRPTTFGMQNAVLDRIDALLWAGRPGEEGGNALVDIIYGDVN